LIREERIREELIPEDRIPEERIFRWDGRDGGAAAAKRVPVVDRRACPLWMEGRVRRGWKGVSILNLPSIASFSLSLSLARGSEKWTKGAQQPLTPPLSRARARSSSPATRQVPVAADPAQQAEGGRPDARRLPGGEGGGKREIKRERVRERGGEERKSERAKARA
jgi:hypothetical protein